MSKTKMLPRTSPPAYKGLDISTAMNFAGVVIVLTYMVQRELVPQIAILRQVQEAICGGELDFVYAINGIGIPMWSRTHAIPSIKCQGSNPTQCSDLGNDCCAPTAANLRRRGTNGAPKEEATCRDNYIPVRNGKPLRPNCCLLYTSPSPRDS